MGIRCNTREGTADVYEVERAQWLYHPDDSVDLAAWQGGIPSTFDWFTLDEDMIVARDALTTWDVGAGDLAYTIGLFRLLVGNRRNLTIVHSGNIAMIPGDEKIPVWDKHLGRSVETVGYLVELGSLEGLSGAPVFARRTFRFGGKPDDGFSAGLLPSSIFLLGVWQGMWTGISDRNVVAAGPVDGSKPIVPVGVGVVVPSDKIRELLDIASATQPSG